jgi:two-component system, OmpR family, sensor kinase
MDGFKHFLNESLRRKLSVTLSLGILGVALVAGIFSFLSAFNEAYELQDDVLRQVAALMDRQHLSPDILAGRGSREGNEESRVTVQRLGDARQASLGVDDGGPLPLPKSLPNGLQTLRAAGETFRVLVRTTATGEQIAVAQETGFRNQSARASALRTVLPFLVLVPILLIAIPDLVRKMFRRVALLAHEIDQRAEQELHPVEERHIPAEVRPFVAAINRLLVRVARSMEVQRRFVADAAHELRTPLTALSLQAELMSETDMSDAARERLGVLRTGIERGRNLLNQLLTFARTQSVVESPKSPVSVQGIYRRVLEDLLPLAAAKRIDIGVEGQQDALVWVSEKDLTTVVRNLVDNAIRYTPDDGRIDLAASVRGDTIVLTIKDTGPGILEADYDRVFDPFYRALGSEQLGSGLGLSIVKAILDRIGAEVRLAFSNGDTQSGLCVSVLIPVRRALPEIEATQSDSEHHRQPTETRS